MTSTLLKKVSSSNFPSYVLGVIILLITVPLSWAPAWVFASGLLILVALSLLHTRRLFRKAELAEARRDVFDEQLCRVREMSSVDELSAGIAHEINNPLGIIAQETQWMQHLLKSESIKHLKEKTDLDESIREISSQVDRCKEIVHKLLSLAREMEPVIQYADINDIVLSMADLVARQAGPKNIAITRDLQSNMPMVYSDPPLLRQVVLNLLINAIHAVNQDGSIIVTTRSRENRVEITVADSGCGIARENLGRVFTPFFSTKPQGKGTGLGLAICRGIIERLGGHISVDSEAGKWTVFTIHLPLNGSRAKENG
ncbi:MAG TPA: ATP-binding protein [Desulfomonilaceae bacterium]|nr:ATP-binding protein [Desulfomonilaceae bacterium]